MHNPQKRILPPPSAPPPKNITRSGRIPRPKGAPPGGAKLTNTSRNYEWDAEQRNRNSDAENEDTLRRRESLSIDEESTSEGVGCDSSWSSSSSERKALPSAASFSGGGSMTGSDLETSSSNSSHGSGWRYDEERRDRRIGYNDGKELRESPNGWSSDADQEAAKFGTRPRDDVSEEEWDRTCNQGYLRSHRRCSGPARVSYTDREGHNRTDDRHGKHKERSRRQDKERKVVKKIECVEDTRELDGSESPFHYLGEERQRSSDLGSHDSDLRSSSRRQGSSERQRLNNRFRRDSGENNGAEKQVGCSRNRKPEIGENRSREYKKSRQSDKDSPYAEENGITRGQDRARYCARLEGGPAGKADHSPAAGIPGDKSPASISRKDAGSSGTEKTARNPSMGGSTPVGKPVRGARWGEAIGVRSKVFDTATIPTGRSEVRDFISSPLRSGPGTVLRCFIERSRGGPHKLSRVYSMYADLEDGSGRLLLAARKLLASKTAYYIICTRQDDLFRESGRRGGSSFLGKLRATSSAHTEYALYDSGQNPALVDTAIVGGDFTSNRRERESKTSTSFEHSLEGEEGHEELRRELGVIVYKFDKKEQRTGKRRMEVAIPQVRRRGDAWEQVSWQPRHIKEGMKLSFGRIRYQGGQNLLQDHRLVVFHQRESRYDPLSSCLVDFKGRATAPSVKNFQLLKSPPEDNAKREQYYSEGAGKDEGESDDLPRPVYLQMGKVGRDCFNVDVEWPLSLVQAFAVCLSRFDTNARF